ncbi:MULTISPECIES: hypothetical protein [Fictibacillus]|uniref:Lipoprotein n=1 Tax=Fictibacillus enclensis TaxID=1017270 RepID=A0A0V8J4N9_9BACL|nr:MULTISPECIES: hypothetical protein [Fictibacillus]KSU81889.1 hypothetical protein AS030_16510 [Fictibacillus enclensis]RXZ01317.1 hypothetical protein DMO16_17645 [Fictibacillus sp. S7]SCC27505.1 hypothetical protein GA0061096_3473 [Fictibacillus enclensis]
MNKSFLMKIGASLLAIMLMTACNSNSDTEKQDSSKGTEQKVDDEKKADQTSTDSETKETGTDTEKSDQ